MVANSNLHYHIIKGIIDNGFAPSVDDLSDILGSDKDEVIKGLYDLQDYHGVVLHPNEPKVWVIHPFSSAPTNFYVKSQRGQRVGFCALCSLGEAALLNEDVIV